LNNSSYPGKIPGYWNTYEYHPYQRGMIDWWPELSSDERSWVYKAEEWELESPGRTGTALKITKVLDRIEELLLEKNRKYGDSALNPIRIFSSADALEQLKVRMDDKLSRVKNAQLDEDEEVVLDLIGYLILYLAALEGDDGTEE
jgi:hypothetical protein